MKILTWRRLALAGAASTALLTARVLTGRPLIGRHPVRAFRHEYTARTGVRMTAMSETRDQELERRLAAVEEHLQHLPPERVS